MVNVSTQLTIKTGKQLVIISAMVLMAALSFLASAPVSAQTNKATYISDILFVPMRSGPGNQYRIINSAMKSGTPLTQLQVSQDGDWTQVKTAKGTQGWIRTQYLLANVPARERLSTSLTVIDQLKTENNTLKAQLKSLNLNNTELKQNLKGQNTSQQTLTAELQNIKTISANAIKVDVQYRALLAEHELLKTERDSLKADNEQLLNNNEISFMLYGALLIILGIIIAAIVPRIMKRKKHYSDWA